MDTFVDSCWYYLRYTDCTNEVEPFNSDTVNKMLPVDIYIGGKEHGKSELLFVKVHLEVTRGSIFSALLHLYYARFISYFLHSVGLTNFKEPFTSLLCQGKVRNKTYKNSEGRYLKADQIEFKGKFYIIF